MTKISKTLDKMLEREQKFYQLTTTTLPEYMAAIETLLDHAGRGVGQGSVCIDFLLSLHDSYDHKFGLANLCGLDTEIFYAALQALRGRVSLRLEMHELSSDVDSRIRALCVEGEQC